jgi:hypothetical protein
MAIFNYAQEFKLAKDEDIDVDVDLHPNPYYAGASFLLFKKIGQEVMFSPYADATDFLQYAFTFATNIYILGQALFDLITILPEFHLPTINKTFYDFCLTTILQVLTIILAIVSIFTRLIATAANLIQATTAEFKESNKPKP